MKKIINFKKLLKLGLKYELLAQNIICKNLQTEIKKTCNNFKYDFKTSDNKKYEVKFDRMAKNTNNFFIEYGTYYLKTKTYQKTGISSTYSNYYILIYEDDQEINYYVISTKILKKLIDDNKYIDKKGCFNSQKKIFSNGYLFNIEFIKNNSKYVFTEIK